MAKYLLCVLAGVVLSVSTILGASVFNKPPTSKLHKGNAVTLYGAVSTNSAIKIITQIKDLQDGSKNPIYLYIDSPGGEVFAGTKIIDAMLASKRPVYTVDIGSAISMAAFIESYGVKRYMLPHAILMYHNASGGYEGDVVRVASELQLVNKLVLELNTNVSKRSGVPMETLMLKENSEWWLMSQEALDNHLIDEIKNIGDYPPEKVSDLQAN